MTVVDEIPQDLADCKDIQGDISKVTDWIKTRNLLAIPGNVLKHYTKTVREVTQIQDAWANGNFEEAGEDVTALLFTVLGAPGEETPNPLF